MSLQSSTDPGRTLGQFGLAVAGLVVGAALLFALIGWVSDDGTEPTDPGPVAASETDAATPTEGTSPAMEPTDQPTQPTVEPTTPAGTPTTAPTDAPETAPDETEPDDATDEPTEEATEDEVEPPATTFDPAEISVQVLDGVRDGGTTARDVADRLEEDGFDLVAFNRAASTYTETTLFYTDGHEEEGSQLADEYGWTTLLPNDVGLSSSVDVHVIVGTDEQ